jgi:hypothetical protein
MMPVVAPTPPAPIETEADSEQQTHRLDPRVAQKIRDVVESGIKHHQTNKQTY